LLLDQLPPGSQPPFWTVSPRGLEVTYSPVALYQGSGTWTDYTATFDAQVVANEAAWVVRDNGILGYAVILDADNDALNTANALRVVQTGGLGSAPVASVRLPFDLRPGSWHAVKTVVVGSHVDVYVDGRFVTGFEAPVPPPSPTPGSGPEPKWPSCTWVKPIRRSRGRSASSKASERCT
jgi:alpha-L-rhamnosidase